jgi:hypothetical protein
MPIPSNNADKAAADKATVAPANKAAVALANRAAMALADKTAVALASEVGLGFSPGNKTHPQIGALAPEVCLPVPRKTATRFHRKLLPLALASLLITSCSPPKPIPKTTTHTT